MQTHQRPKSLKLRKVTKHAAGEDIGHLHVIDWWLWRATKDLISPRWYDHCASRIGRYLDGEEEREGTYR
jgi:hypothetical protein